LTWFLPAPIGNFCADSFQELTHLGSSFSPFGAAHGVLRGKASSIRSNAFQWLCNLD
jgi:hypothetical protein